MDDNEIISLFNSRSEEALHEITHKYGRLLSKLARDITGSDEDAAECVNDTLLALWKCIPPEAPDPLLAYIMRILRNLSIKRFRSNSAQKRNAGELLCIDELCEVLTFDGDEADENLLSAVIDRFLASLKSADRNLFVRRYWHNESVRDIAFGMKMSESAVKVRLYRLRGKMKTHLNKEGFNV